MPPETHHASLIALPVAGVWRGVMIEGPSGSGKSDLLLRAIAQGFRLAADDRVMVFRSKDRLFGRAPEVLAGLIEARGVGMVRRTHLAVAEISLIARCAASPEAVERMPEPSQRSVLGLDIPTFDLWPLEASAPAKLQLALEHLGP